MNAVSASLIRAPDFKQKYDATRMSLIDMAHSVAELEPEFILKVSCTLSAVEKKTKQTKRVRVAF